MRVSAKVQAHTRQLILKTAHRLFCLVGYETATMRDIAKAVGVATGTLFNYFSGKESIAATLVLSRLHAVIEFEHFQTFEECIFAHAAGAFRHWKPCRNYLLPVLQSTLLGEGTTAHAIQDQHLQGLQQLSQSSQGRRLTALELNLYWTLFFGAAAFWVKDQSRKQEATLAMLDESVRMFTTWVQCDPSQPVSSFSRLSEDPRSA